MSEPQLTFEEQFPTLAIVKCDTFTRACIMKTCVDKKKFIDVIKKSTWSINDNGDATICIELLLKKLNIEGLKNE